MMEDERGNYDILPSMLPYRDSRLTRIALGIFFLLVIGYAYFEARGILFGPSITVTSQISEVHDPFVTIKGQADRISSLSMNGKDIPVTETGAFSEPYLLAPGDNKIVLVASDKYGRSRRQVIEIVYVPSSTSSQMVAPSGTSSVQTASSTPVVAPHQQ
jgi:hypothetical protein